MKTNEKIIKHEFNLCYTENAKKYNNPKTKGTESFHWIQQNVNTRQQQQQRNVISLNCFNEVK